MKKPRAQGNLKQRSYAIPRHYGVLGSYLSEMRERASLTQREVSLELGYSSAQFISNFERGISSPPLAKLKILVRLYKMPVSKVMDLVLEGQREVLHEALGVRPPSRRR